jgi:hypothetical protein
MLLVYAVIALVALIAIASLAVDYGRVQIAKTQLLATADAASRAAAEQLPDQTAATAKAIYIASQGTVDGSALTIAASDIVFGNFASGSFTAGGTPVNALQVTASRTKAKGNPIPLMLASVIGMSSCDVKVSSISTGTSMDPRGFIGLTGVTMKNNTFIGGYNSYHTTNPAHSTATSNGSVGTNAILDGKNNTTVAGDILLGPSGSVTGMGGAGGTTINLTTNIPTPADPAWSPGTNPNGLSQNYSSPSCSTTLPGGTYWFTSLTVNGPLTFSGPTTVYVNGSVSLGDDILAYNSIPANLKIYQLGTNTFGDAGNNNITIVADVSGPHSDFSTKNNLTFAGSGIFNTITVKNNADFYYDYSEGNPVGWMKPNVVK